MTVHVHATTGMLLDGAFATEAIDSSGEVLDIKGTDISSLEEGDGIANYEHEGPAPEPGKESTGGHGQEIVGKIVYAKKIFGASDCANDREKFFWEKVKLPLIYGIVRLYDGAGHPGAISLAAGIRDSVANNEPIMCRFSIEGSTILTSPDKKRLLRSVARKVAITTKPCNKSAVSGLLADPHAPAGFDKVPDEEAAKSLVSKLADTFKAEQDDPTRQKLGGYEFVVDEEYLKKATEAGSYNVAPSALTGGAALQREWIGGVDENKRKKNQLMSILRDHYDKSEAELESIVKAAMPEADESFIKLFQGMVADYKMKKAEDQEAPPPKDVDDPDFAKPDSPTRKPSSVKADAPILSNFNVPGNKKTKATRYIVPEMFNPTVRGETSMSLFGMIQGTDADGRKKNFPAKKSETYFDDEFGYLHTPMGSFKVFIPDAAEFNQYLTDPSVQRSHDAAMKHWLVLNRLLLAGKLPKRVAMTAALFSGMSPSVAVPMQELAFSHVVDMMNDGLDPTKGVTEKDRKEFVSRTKTGAALPEYMNGMWASPKGDVTRIGSTSPNGGELEEGEDVADSDIPEEQGAKGAQKGLLYPGQKWNAVANYYKLNQSLVGYLSSHRADARAIARQLSYHKLQSSKHEDKLQRQYKAAAEQAVARGMGTRDGKGYKLNDEGQAFVSARMDPQYLDHTGFPGVEGFAPKTIRYSLAMLGAGNVTVPDTHFIRHLFGLPQDSEVDRMTRRMLGRDYAETESYKEKAFAPNAYLKSLLWDESRPDLLESIDRYYKAHHPAYTYADNRFFGGAKNDQALFPAFWAHWLAIAPHERDLGQRTTSYNGGTDHSTYWHAVKNILRAHGLGDVRGNRPLGKSEEFDDAGTLKDIAKAHNDMHNELGPGAASLFYCEHLLPKVFKLANKDGELGDDFGDGPIDSVDPQVMKVESAVVLLNSTMGKLVSLVKADPSTPSSPPISSTMWGGKSIQPGEGWREYAGDKIRHAILAEGPDYIVAAPVGANGNVSVFNAHRLPKHLIKVGSLPKSLDSTTVDGVLHTHPTLSSSPEQRELVHGMSLEGSTPAPSGATTGVNAVSSGWKKNAKGEPVYVKYVDPGNENFPDFPGPMREGLYHNMARDFFGLGDHVPLTAVVKHPVTGRYFAAIKGIPNGEHVSYDSGAKAPIRTPAYDPKHRSMYLDMHNEGLIDKMLLMNTVMGNTDRHDHNFMYDKDTGKLMLIDHDRTFTPMGVWDSQPAYMNQLADIHGTQSYEQTSHPESIKWLLGLDPDRYEKMLTDSGLPQGRAIALGGGLRNAQKAVVADPHISREGLFKAARAIRESQF